jgi:hypothetical protein
MRERRGIDLAPLLGGGGNWPDDDQNSQTDNEAPEHVAIPRIYRPTNLMSALDGIKAGCVHFPAFMVDRRGPILTVVTRAGG